MLAQLYTGARVESTWFNQDKYPDRRYLHRMRNLRTGSPTRCPAWWRARRASTRSGWNNNDSGICCWPICSLCQISCCSYPFLGILNKQDSLLFLPLCNNGASVNMLASKCSFCLLLCGTGKIHIKSFRSMQLHKLAGWFGCSAMVLAYRDSELSSERHQIKWITVTKRAFAHLILCRLRGK